jgi:hypothetical protein
VVVWKIDQNMFKFGIVWVLLLAFHPVHVSISSLEYDERGSELKLFLKVYADDLENDCRLLTDNPDLVLYESVAGPDKNIIHNYLNGKIIVEINKVTLTGNIVSIDYDEEEVRINATYKIAGKVKNVRIVNKVMIDLFSDQVNLFILRIGDWEEGIKFTPENNEFIIKR